MTKTVFVTGSSSGLGKACCQHFLNKGWNVAATSRQKEIGFLESDNKNVIYPYLDVTDVASIKTAISQTNIRFGQINVVINCAGFAQMGPLEVLSSKQIKQQLETNFFGCVNVIQSSLDSLKKSQGTIVNISSLGGEMSFPLGSSYHASKWALEGLSESIRFELAAFNVKVKLIQPGGLKTNFVNEGMHFSTNTEYESMTTKMKKLLKKVEPTLPGPEYTAKVIFKAVTQNTAKFRYATHSCLYKSLRTLLPDILWFRLINKMTLG